MIYEQCTRYNTPTPYHTNPFEKYRVRPCVDVCYEGELALKEKSGCSNANRRTSLTYRNGKYE